VRQRAMFVEPTTVVYGQCIAVLDAFICVEISTGHLTTHYGFSLE